MQVRGHVSRQTGSQVAECPMLGIEYVHAFDGVEELTIVLGRGRVLAIRQEHSHECEQELQVVRCGRQHERINAERLPPIPKAHLEIRSAVLPRDLAVAATDIQNECSRPVLLRVIDEEIRQNRLARSRRSENQHSELVGFMQVEVVWRLMIRLEHNEVLCSQMPVYLFAAVGRVKEREIGVVSAQQPCAAQIERLVSRDDRQIRIERVVGLANERAFLVAEDLDDIGRGGL